MTTTESSPVAQDSAMFLREAVLTAGQFVGNWEGLGKEKGVYVAAAQVLLRGYDQDDDSPEFTTATIKSAHEHLVGATDCEEGQRREFRYESFAIKSRIAPPASDLDDIMHEFARRSPHIAPDRMRDIFTYISPFAHGNMTMAYLLETVATFKKGLLPKPVNPFEFYRNVELVHKWADKHYPKIPSNPNLKPKRQVDYRTLLIGEMTQ